MLREKFARYSTNPFKHFRALSSDWTSSCRLRRMQRKRNANLIEKQQINKLSPRMTRLLQTSKSHPSFRRHNTALDPTKLGLCAAWLSRFAGAFLNVFSSVLIQLHFDDIWCFCCVAASCTRALFVPLDFDTAAANPCLACQIILRRFALLYRRT